MKTYPSIFGPDRGFMEANCLVFNKLDGSNLRMEYNPKQGWYKFGSRTKMIDEKHPEFGIGIKIFKNKYADAIEKVLRDKYSEFDGAIVFCEFFGPHSFSGQHDVQSLRQLGFDIHENEPKDLVLFDVSVHKKGFLSPREFVARFGHLHIPEVIYEGKLTWEFIQDVRSGKYPVREGVVAKGGEGHKLWMLKIKTDQYKKELEKRWGEMWTQFWE